MRAATLPPAADAPARPATAGERWQAAGAGLFFALFGALPLDTASAVGGALGRWIGPRLGISRRARRNLRAAFPALSDAGIEAIVRAMWNNLGRVAAEYRHLHRLRVFGPGSRVEVIGLDRLARALAEERRLILFSGHLGNWEIAALAAGQYGLAVAQIYRALNNPLIDRMIARLRGDRGEFIPKGAIASRRAVAALREGMHLSLLVDQKLNDGIPVPFFGRDAMTAPALARLALRYECDVVPVRVERLAGAHFRLTVYPPLEIPHTGNRTADIAALMTRVNATLEAWIRERPEQWLWLHNRWPD